MDKYRQDNNEAKKNLIENENNVDIQPSSIFEQSATSSAVVSFRDKKHEGTQESSRRPKRDSVENQSLMSQKSVITIAEFN